MHLLERFLYCSHHLFRCGLLLDSLMVLLLQVFCCSSLSTCVIVDQIGKILVFWPKAISWTYSASTICVHSPTVKLVGVIDNHAIVVACFVAWTTSGGVSSCAFQGNVKWLDHINSVREILVRLNHLFTLLDHNFFLTYLFKFVQTHSYLDVQALH